jgi:pilus assembly protein FimV
METPTLEQRIESVLESGGADQTAEIDLDDLGLDLEDLRDETLGGPLDDDEATLLAGAPDFASRNDEGESDDFDPGLTTPAPDSMARDRDATAEVPHFGSAGARDMDATSELDTLDIDIEDLSAALEAGETEVQPARAGGDTVRQPRYPGADRRGRDPSLDEDLTEILTEEDDALTAARDFDLGDIGDSDGESEVGTKLDLARAYMDMGDPEGAQSILQEVVEEGDSSQREEAERLLKALP